MNSLKPIKIGISSCLLGNEVRYDGGHQFNRYINQQLVDVFDLVPLCPEAAIGMGVPRPPIQLEWHDGDTRAIGRDDKSIEVTAELNAYGRKLASELTGYCGFIFKSGSPSCGVEKVKLFDGETYQRVATGLFANQLMQRCPQLPVVDEDQLLDPVLRDRFLEHVFFYARWLKFIDHPTAAAFVSFHAANKFNILAHDESLYRALGPLVAAAGDGDLVRHCQQYATLMNEAMCKLPSRKSHTNVLLHLAGFLKKKLAESEKKSLHEAIDAYSAGEVPRHVPATLLAYFVNRYPDPYLAEVRYIYPDQAELALRYPL